MLGIKIVREEK